ncbi:MAG: VWA domain-containing protein [Puniceicoccales bacterium]|nr:VWA domain-containing protein [Puniceicoccales bacterium]
MNFLHPFYLWIASVTCSGLILLFIYSEKKWQSRRRKLVTDKAWHRLVEQHSFSHQLLKYFLYLLGTLFLMIALARPRWGYSWKEYHSQGVDILFAIDVSRSMLAEDLKPNRLERTKIAIQDFVPQLHGHRIGLIAFAYDSFIQCPMTLDYRAFLQSLEALDIYTIPQQGTAIASAIRAAEKALEKTRNERIVLIFSDGEELKKDAITAAEAAAKDGIHIFTIGVGSLEGGMIPLAEKDRPTRYLQDADGKDVITKLDESTLQKIAEITDGRYVHLSVQELQELLQELQTRFPIREQEVYQEKVFTERFPYFLLLAIGLWFIEALISTYRRSKLIHQSYNSPWIIFLFTLILFYGGMPESFALQSKGEKYFAKKRYDLAQAYYEKEILKHPEDPKLLYNLGTTYLVQKKWPEAIKRFRRLLTVSELELKDKIFFNLGNIYFEQGKQVQEIEPLDVEVVQKLWEKSILQYDNALALSENYTAAQNNRRYVQKCLEEFLKQHKPPEEDKSDEQQKNSQRSPSGDQKSGSGDSQSPEKNEDQGQEQQDPQQPQEPQQSSSGDEKSKSDGDKSDSKEGQSDAQPEDAQGEDSQNSKSPQDESKESNDQESSSSFENKFSDGDASPGKEAKDSAKAQDESENFQQTKPKSDDAASSSNDDLKENPEPPPSQKSSEREQRQPQKTEPSQDQPTKGNAAPNAAGKDQSTPQNPARKQQQPQKTEAAQSSSSGASDAADKGKMADENGKKEEAHASDFSEKKAEETPVSQAAAGSASSQLQNTADKEMTLLEAKALLDSEAGHEKKLLLFHGPDTSTDILQPW